MASAEWLEQVRRVLAYVQASDATEVEAASADGFRVRLVRRPGLRTSLTRKPSDEAASTSVASLAWT